MTTNPDGTPYWQVFWTGGSPGQGQPYYNHGIMSDPSKGVPAGKTFIAPASATSDSDPAVAAWGKSNGGMTNPTAGNFSSAPSTWNGSTGKWDGGNFFDSSLGGLILGGGAVGGIAAAGAGAGAAAGGAGAAEEGDAAALAGADAGATGAGAGTGLLPATATVGNTGALVPATTSSMAAPGAAAGLPNWLKTAQDVGQSLGAASSGRAAGRNADNNANIAYANAQTNLYNSELAAPGKVAHNAVKGDILSNARDVSLAAPSDIPVPTISGGLRPSMFSPTTRQIGSNITANAAATPLPTPTAPVLNPMETAGTGDTILNTAGYLSNLVKPATDIWKLFNA